MNKLTKLTDSVKYLTNEMIEEQAQQDLLVFSKKIGKELTFPIYPDEVIEALWGIKVEYVDKLPCEFDEDTLACYLPKKKAVLVSVDNKGVEGRVSFTLAHEVGHISLHGFLYESGLSNKKDIDLERQADTYASSLLMPKEHLMKKISSLGYIFGEKVDLGKHGRELVDYFSVSFRALEIRLTNLGIDYCSGYYNVEKRKDNRIFDEMECERQSWNIEDVGRA